MFKSWTPVKLNLAFTAVLMASVHFAAVNTWAWPPTYGAEFELLHPDMVHVIGPDNLPKFENENRMKQKLADHLKDRCLHSSCTIEKIPGKWGEDFEVRFPDGWWIKLSSDPGCVEIMFKPSTLEELEKRKHTINDFIFKAGAEIGLKPSKNESTHFNMGVLSAFNNNATDFLKFFVDYANHPHLALGSLGKDLDNAPPLSILDQSQREALAQIIERHDKGELNTIQKIAHEIQKKVYTSSYNKNWAAYHYQAVGLKRVNMADLKKEDAPMELRGVWSQDSAENFNLVARLIEGRIKYLSKNPSPIVYNAPSKTTYTNSQLKSKFYIYVEEAGLKYSDFETLLPEIVRNAPWEPFMNPKSSAPSKLNKMKSYWPEIVSSQWVRDQVVKILSHPDVASLPEAQKYRDQIKELAHKSLSAESAETSKPSKSYPKWLEKNINSALKYFNLSSKEAHYVKGSNTELNWNVLVYQSVDKKIQNNIKPQINKCEALF